MFGEYSEFESEYEYFKFLRIKDSCKIKDHAFRASSI